MLDQEIAAQHQMNVWVKIRDCGAGMGCAAKIGLVVRDGICQQKYDRAARRWDAPAKTSDRRWWCSNNTLAKIRMVARQGDAPAKIRDGGATMGCAGLNRQWDAPAKIGNGVAARRCAGQNRQWDAPAKIGNSGAAIGCAG